MAKKAAKKKASKKKAAAKKEKVERLTAMQERFVIEYLRANSATEAAINAGAAPGSAHVTASKWLSLAKVQRALRQGRKDALQDAQGVLRRTVEQLIDAASVDVADLVDDEGHPRPISEWPARARRAIQQISVTRFGNKDVGVGEVLNIRLADRLSALDKLMKHVGGYELDNNQKSNPIEALLEAVAGADEARGILDRVRARTQGGGS